LTIVFEDDDIIVVDKIPGLLTIGCHSERERTAHFFLNEYVKKGNPKSRNRVFIVHRLDRDTSGLMVFAKNENAKRYLQDHWQECSKRYVAVVHGILPEKEGVITSYLFEHKSFRVYSVKDPEQGKFSKTGYKVIQESDRFSLLEVELFTGRKNQIRVHFAESGHPVAGDQIYGPDDKSLKRLALHAASLKITHPHSHKEMLFETEIPRYFKFLLKSPQAGKKILHKAHGNEGN